MKEYIITVTDIVFYTTTTFLSGCASYACGILITNGDVLYGILGLLTVLGYGLYASRVLLERRVK